MSEAQPSSLLYRVTGWVGTHLLAVVTASGLATYGLLRVSYATFYGRFDVEPEEVGLGQTQILAQTGLAMFVYVLIIAVYGVVAFLAFKALGLRSIRVEPNAPFWRRVMAFTTGPYWIILVPTVIYVASLVFLGLHAQARAAADQVERGETVRLPAWRVLQPPLHVVAIPVTLTTLGEDELPAELTSPSLRYLGQAGGVLVLYDWKAERVIRVPANSLVVMTPT
jgi:hypothetical protein